MGLSIIRQLIYFVIFVIPVHITLDYFNVKSIPVSFSIAFILSFFAAILNDVWGVLNSINDKLDK